MDWLNTDWKKYVHRGDKIVLHVQKDSRVIKLSAYGAFVFFGVFSFLFIYVFWFLLSNMFFAQDAMLTLWPNPLWVALIALGLGGLIARLAYLSDKSDHYILTDKGIYYIGGLLHKKSKFVSYTCITDVATSRCIIEMWCNCGSVGVGTASGGDYTISEGHAVQHNELDISRVKEYEKIQDYILKKLK